MNDKYLVQIYANTDNGTKYIGTGYAINDGIILTANHVVYFPNRAANPQLKMVWTELDNHEIEFTDNDIVFNNAILDIAIIHYDSTKLKLKPPKIKLATVIAIYANWSSRGFLKAGTEGNTRTDKGIIGKVAGIKKHEIELHSEVKVIEKDGWSGLSGSPVFIDIRLVAPE